MTARKKLILFMGHADADFVSRMQSGLSVALATTAIETKFVWARDGADANWKVANQKFDAIVIDSQAARFKEAHFLKKFKVNRTTAHPEVIAILPSLSESPAHLELSLKELDCASQTLCHPLDIDSLVRALCKSLSAGDAGIQNESEYSVDVRVLNGILKSTVFICQQFGLTEIQMQKPEIKKLGQAWRGEIGASIEIQSRLFRGALIISFDKSSYLRMYEGMLGEVHFDLNAENSEAIGEISNMILGNAKPDFTNYDIEMTLPKSLKAGEPFPYPAGSASLLIPGRCKTGCLYLEIIAYSLRS